VLFNPSLLDKLYLPLPIIYSDDVVMSRGNRNFHLRLFIKGGALQYGIRAVVLRPRKQSESYCNLGKLQYGIRAVCSGDRKT
jgi:hypothetical protein